MKTLLICRHAKSDWSLELPDFERPLNKRGRRDLEQMGAQLKILGFVPDLVMSSPAERAKTTAQFIADATGFKGSIRFEKSIYEEGYGNLVQLIQSFPDTASKAMVFGHNPTLEQAAQFLLQSAGPVEMPTCAMLCLESHAATWEQAHPGKWTLKWFLIPRLLRGELS